jgi:hypothetical protein
MEPLQYVPSAQDAQDLRKLAAEKYSAANTIGDPATKALINRMKSGFSSDQQLEEYIGSLKKAQITLKQYADLIQRQDQAGRLVHLTEAQKKELGEAISLFPKESRLSISHLRKTLSSKKEKTLTRDQMLDLYANSNLQLAERRESGALPSAKWLQELAQKPVNGAMRTYLPHTWSAQELTALDKDLNNARNTLKQYADRIQRAERSGQPVNFSKAQMDELHNAEGTLHYYTFKPNVTRSSFKQGYAR